MREAPDVDNPAHHRLVKNLFTDIAVLDHLIANRFAESAPHHMPTRAFGVLSWFDRNQPDKARIAAIAHDFQWSVAETAEVLDLLARRGAVTPGDPVSVTPLGHQIYQEQADAGVPEIAALFDEADMADVRVAVRVLADLRRTLDNLPDR